MVTWKYIFDQFYAILIFFQHETEIKVISGISLKLESKLVGKNIAGNVAASAGEIGKP